MECNIADFEANMNSILPFSVTENNNPPFTCVHPLPDHGFYQQTGIMMDVAAGSIEMMEVEAEECISKKCHDTKRKRRLSAKQLETLERSFQEEARLAPTMKMSLSKELNLEPRQVAIWFQNRRARHKTRALELLYNELQQQYNAIFNEKQRLQGEVQKLQAMLSIQECWTRQVSTVPIEIPSFEEIADNISIQPLSTRTQAANMHQIGEACNCFQILYGLPSLATNYSCL